MIKKATSFGKVFPKKRPNIQKQNPRGLPADLHKEEERKNEKDEED